ncbi:MAG: hypothetical protein KF784_08600 [Fimbriimonadaceae bacterium]|nr:hypothetical protein [Fimbriimonadaceae bacterium]
MDFWTEEVSDEKVQELVSKAAHEIKKRHMEAPAILFLEMNRPLSNIAAQTSIVFSPFLVPLIGFENLDNYSQVFSKRENVELLIQELEKKPAPAEGVSQ